MQTRLLRYTYHNYNFPFLALCGILDDTQGIYQSVLRVQYSVYSSRIWKVRQFGESNLALMALDCCQSVCCGNGASPAVA